MKTPGLEIRLFGGLTVMLDGQPLPSLPTRKAEALLAYLVCQQRPFPREHLADLLWDDRPPEQAQANLRSLLSSLRPVLGPYLHITRHTISFNPHSPHWLDVAEFAAKTDSNAAPPTPSPTQMQEAIILYRGDFLQGFYIRESRGFEEWALLERERWQRTAVLLLRHLTNHYQNNGHYTHALTCATHLLQLDPLSEQAQQNVILLLARTGQPHAALKQYAATRRLLAEELDIPPTPETTALYERIRTSLSRPRHNLPPPPTPFIGREAELATIQSYLAQPNCRLLTLLGPGGIGKTRLALQTATQILAHQPGMFLHGLRFVPLEGLTTATLLPGALAAALPAALQGRETPHAQLLHFLRDQELLLILDNYEHLLTPDDPAGITLLADILQQAPLVKLLVTSRERLNLHQEWVFDLPGLQVPPPNAPAQPEAYSATQLFYSCARRLRHDFALDAAEWTAVTDICRLLEGLPLGIELAAALVSTPVAPNTWVRPVSCAQIAHQIAHDIQFLHSHWHNLPPRHRSLTAVFDHSWALLTPTAQATLARLAVFRGGFTLAAAQAVAQTGPQSTAPLNLPASDAASLATLTSQSLLRPAENGRFHLHTLLRHYAWEKLPPHEQAETSQAHAHFLAHWVRQQEPYLDGPHARQILADLRHELDNIRQAWQWAVHLATQSPETAVPLLDDLLPGLTYLHDVQGSYQEGFDQCAAALHALTPATPPPHRLIGRLLTRQGRLAHRLGHTDTARQIYHRSITYLRPDPTKPPLPDTPTSSDLALALTYLAELERHLNELEAATAHNQESLALAQQAQDRQNEARAWLHLGNVAYYAGQLALARQHYQAALSICTTLGSRRQTAVLLDNLGSVLMQTGDYPAAYDAFTHSLTLRQELDDQWGIATAEHNLGVLLWVMGDTPAAAARYQSSAALYRQMGHQEGLAQALTNLGGLQLFAQELTTAQETLQEALHHWQAIGSILGTADVLIYLGQVQEAQGKPAEGLALMQQGIQILRHAGADQELAAGLSDLALMLNRQGNLSAATTALDESVRLAQALESPPLWLRVMTVQADTWQRQGQMETAVTLATQVLSHPMTRARERRLAQDIRSSTSQKKLNF